MAKFIITYRLQGDFLLEIDAADKTEAFNYFDEEWSKHGNRIEVVDDLQTSDIEIISIETIKAFQTRWKTQRDNNYLND